MPHVRRSEKKWREALVASLPSRSYFGIAWTSALRILAPMLRAILRERMLWDDLFQEIVVVAWEAAHNNLDPDADLQVIRRLVQRRVYAALCSMGFRRKKYSSHFSWMSADIQEWYETAPQTDLELADPAVFFETVKVAIFTEWGEDAWAYVWAWAQEKKWREDAIVSSILQNL